MRTPPVSSEPDGSPGSPIPGMIPLPSPASARRRQWIVVWAALLVIAVVLAVVLIV